MPRVRERRGSEMPQRLSIRGPGLLRSSSSDSDPLPHRPMTDRSPKLGDRRSPRTAISDQKKLGTRIAGLETQLEQAQGELKILKDQLASAEAAKKEAQKELENRNTKPPVSVAVTADENQKETDVFEVPVEKVEVTHLFDQDELEEKESTNIPPESPEKPKSTMAEENEEIKLLNLKIKEKEKELEASAQETEDLKHELTEAKTQISSMKAKEEKTNLKLTQVEEEFRKSKNEGVQMQEKLKEVETAKEALETEMKKLRVQTEQWKKAADAAAAILSGGMEMNSDRRVSERCGSMEKHYGFDGYGGFGSPGLGDESDDGFGNAKRKGSAIRKFGDLWKKKGQK